jgi:S1-C subfamily serine protease
LRVSESLLQDLSDGLARVVEGTGQSVLRVEARRTPASGVPWTADGLVLAAHHTVQWDEGIEIGLPDGGKAAAEVVGRDPTTDLALLRAKASGLDVPRWADPAAARAGHLVLGLARPGRSVRATLGVLSVRGDEWRTPAGGRIDHYLQADLPRQPGFSGGLLVSASGDALGLQTAGLVRGALLALPLPTLRRVADSLATEGQVRRGYLGIGTYAVRLPRALAAELGRDGALLVVSVDDGSPAAEAGMTMGDVLLAFGGTPLEHPVDLLPLLEDARVGETVPLTISRAGAVREVAVTVGQRGGRA